jgi:Cu/Zn superoxide dismutase
VYQTRRLAGCALGIALSVALVLEGSAFAQGGQSAQVRHTQSRDSGVSGTADLKDVEGGVQVTLEMLGLPEAGVKHINHIHAGGTCADDRAGRTAPVTIPLKTVVAQEDGTGSATTTIEDVTVGELFGEDRERFILLHAKTEKGQGVPPGIACADLDRTGANGTSLNGETTMIGEVPAMGGPSIVLPTAALLLGAGVLSYAVLRRRL